MAAERSSAGDDMHRTAEEGSTPTDQASLIPEAQPDPWADLSEAHLREALAASICVHGPDQIATINMTNYLVVRLLMNRGQEEALPLAQRVYDYYQRLLPEGDINLCNSMTNLAACLLHLQKHEEAERLYIKSLSIKQHVLGHEHPDTISMCSSVASAQSSMGKHAEAEALHRRSVDFHTRLLGAEHTTTILSIMALGMCLTAAGEFKRSLGLLHKVLNLNIRVHGLHHSVTLTNMLHLGRTYLDMRDYAQAERMLRWGLRISPGVGGPDDFRSRNLREALITTFITGGKGEEALPLMREQIEMLQLTSGEEDPRMLFWECVLARLLADLGRHAEAEQLAARILEPCTRVMGPQHADTRGVQDLLVACRRALQPAEAQQAASAKAKRGGRRR